MNKKYIVNSLSVDLLMIEDIDYLTQKRPLYARPLRITPDARLGALYRSRVHPIFLDELGNMSLFRSLESYDLEKCKRVKQGESYAIPYALTPLNDAKSSDFMWEIIAKQFGIYIYLKVPDDVIERLVVALCDKGRYRVLSWDVSDYVSNDGVEYGWFIQLSSGLSASAIASFISNFFSVVLADTKKMVDHSVLIDAEKKLGDLESRLKNLSEGKNEEFLQIENELKLAYHEISNLHSSIEKLEAESKVLGEQNSISLEAKKLKRSDAERVLASVLYSLYQHIAFSPDTPKIIVERFKDSSALWELLTILNTGGEISKTSLHGAAGKVGWREVKKHISTGEDDRGRIYVRPAKGKHRFDVVLHWKKNDAEQERLLSRLGNYAYFGDPSVVLA